MKGATGETKGSESAKGLSGPDPAGSCRPSYGTEILFREKRKEKSDLVQSISFVIVNLDITKGHGWEMWRPVENEVEAVGEDKERVVAKTGCEHMDLGTLQPGMGSRESLPSVGAALPSVSVSSQERAVTCAFHYIRGFMG